MLDAYVRPWIDPLLNTLGAALVKRKVSADAVTWVGFCLGMLAAVAIALNYYGWAVVLVCLNRLADGLDGAVARASQLSDYGGFLDIVCDFIVYATIVFAFGVAQHDNWPYVAFLILSYIGPMVSFLAYAIIAAKRQVTTLRRGQKSFYYLGGLCEGTETAVVMVLFCLLPQHFVVISSIFGLLCWLTTCGRVASAYADFGREATT